MDTLDEVDVDEDTNLQERNVVRVQPVKPVMVRLEEDGGEYTMKAFTIALVLFLFFYLSYHVQPFYCMVQFRHIYILWGSW